MYDIVISLKVELLVLLSNQPISLHLPLHLATLYFRVTIPQRQTKHPHVYSRPSREKNSWLSTTHILFTVGGVIRYLINKSYLPLVLGRVMGVIRYLLIAVIARITVGVSAYSSVMVD